MAKIIDTTSNRRTIKLNIEDVISVVKQYQTLTKGYTNPTIVRDLLQNGVFYIPEDI